MPQFDPTTFAPQLIWLAITFLILYVVMARVALPRIAHVLEERQDRIDDNLERAVSLKAEADEASAAYEASADEARSRAYGVVAEAGQVLANEATRQQDALAADLSGQIETAETRINEAKKDAIGNVRAVAEDVARQAVEALAGEAGDDARITAAVEAAAKERA